MRIYAADYNGILTDFRRKYADKLATPREADVWLVWQDCLGSYADLIKTSKELGLGKPTFCIQHGRGSTSDYAPPNSLSLNSDYFLCWGRSDYERLTLLGYGDRTRIVGCPLNPHIRPRVPHKEKVVLFVPVNTGKEEPENIAVYYELLKMRYGLAQTVVLDNRVALKDKWGFDGKRGVSFNEIGQGFDVIAKLLPWHEKKLYHGSVLQGFQDKSKNNELIFKLLRNVDMVVGLDEGTTEVFAYGHDIPVIIVDGFKYRQYKNDHKSYEVIEGYKTKAATHVQLSELQNAIEYGLANPTHLQTERAEVAEAELGISYRDPVSNIMKALKSEFKD